MGLDPPSLISLSSMLQDLAEKCTPRLVLTLRPQDPIPYWVTHLLYLDGCQPLFMGSKGQVLQKMATCVEATKRGLSKTNFTLPSMQEFGQVLTSRGIGKPKQYKILNDLALKKNRKGTPIRKPESEAESGPGKTTSASAPAGTADGTALSRDGYKLHDSHPNENGEALVEMEGVNVSYGNKSVLGNWSQEVNGGTKNGLWWTVRRGERWGIFGPNGSGKTTILSLICSDHPQTYSLPIRLFGRSRLPEPGRLGTSIFDIQARIGHSSPEIHNHMPKSLTLRKVLANAWADTFRGVPRVDDVANARIDACLRWFQQDLKPASQPGGEASASHMAWADEVLFGGLPFSSQRVALFLRAIIKQPDLIILDEAFGGMDDRVRDRCLLFLAHGETKQFASPSSRKIVESEVSRNGAVKIQGLQESQALVCISHVKEEIPGSVREWICLPETHTGKPARFGRLNGPIEGDYKRWKEIWDM
ncbi:hypothetical protein B0O99DRAFT_624816 [Bisporella sp. PMI_857]|nr:hypothetical protein B0O99DRAFT_624816 [Bisporella sp. PMI_857]